MTDLKPYGRSFIRAFLAGIAIGIGGCVYIGCVDYGFRWVGAVLFAIGLITVFSFGLDLYTGKVGYAVENPPSFIIMLLVIILGNLVGTMFVGLSMPLHTASTMVATKTATYEFLPVLMKGFFCGMLMFIAADFWKTRQSLIATFFCVPVFILAGFEHSIADMFYFFSAGVYSVDAVVFIVTVIIGNALGGILIPLCRKFMYEPKVDEKSQ